jgi:hypothetical protein
MKINLRTRSKSLPLAAIPNLLQDAELYNKEFLAKIATKNASGSGATTKFFELISAKKSKLEIGILRLIGYIPKLLETRTKSCFGISGDPATVGTSPMRREKFIQNPRDFGINDKNKAFAVFNFFLRIIFIFFIFNEGQANAENADINSIRIVDNPKNFQHKIDEATLKQLLMGNSSIGRLEYEKFWQAIGVKSREEKKATIEMIKRDFLVFSEFNFELLECAQKAWIMGRQVKCSRAESVLAAVARNFPSQSDNLGGAIAIQKVKNLQLSIDEVIRNAAARGASLNQNSDYRFTSLAQIERDRTLLQQIINRTRTFLQLEYGKGN